MERIAATLMRAIAVSTLFASAVTTAEAQADYQIFAWVEQGREHLDSPKVIVKFDNPTPGSLLGSLRFAVEWTADGEPQSPDLHSRSTKCAGRAVTGSWCTALSSWFGPTGAFKTRAAVRQKEFPQAFVLINLDYDTEYCVRVQSGPEAVPGIVSPWSKWACARTPSPLPKPWATLQPTVTILPATTGAGVIGGGTPVSALVEWQRNPREATETPPRVAYYTVQQGRITGTDWSTKKTLKAEENTGEAVIPFALNEEPTDDRRFLFRVCTTNISGSSCSPARATSSIKPDPLEKKRERAQFPLPVRAGARVRLPESTTAIAPLPICESARMARERNSPAAPGLEARCLALGPAIDMNALAAKGEVLANQDPLALELRNQQADGLPQRGFDIGMAAAEGQTSVGPGKQKIHDSLQPDERAGFTAAVSFSVDRNMNADLAATGAAIANADPTVATARSAETNVFYRLGFDIASGIFGDPALGAKGNTSTGPASLKIRDALSTAGQRGFNASVAMHLSREYAR